SARESDALRWQSTALGLEAWLRHPIFGGGLGTFLLEREIAGLPSVVIHNVPVWFLAEMGMVGLTAYIAFVACLVVCGIAALRHPDRQAHGLLVGVAVFVLMGLVHDVFFQRTFWFACGLLLAAPDCAVRRRAAAQPAAKENALATSAAATRGLS